MAKLSIIITSYNIENYILDCLKDIAGQSLEDFEAIVVDDGSTDRSAAIADEFCRRDDRFSLIRLQDNTPGGVGTAANVGLEAATGEYVGFADGDDRYNRDMFERLVSCADEHRTDIALCNYYVLDSETGLLDVPADSHRWLSVKQNYPIALDAESRQELLKFIAVPWRKLYRRSLIEEHGLRFPEVDHFFEDNPFHWDVVLSAKSVAYIDEKLCEHRVKRSGQTMSSSPEKLLDVIRNYDLIRDVLVKHQATETYSFALLEWLFAQSSWTSRRCRPGYADTLMAFLKKYYQRHTRNEMRQLLVQHSRRGDATFVAAGAFLGKGSVVRDSYQSYVDRGLKSKFRVASLRGGAVEVARVGLVQSLEGARSALNWLFEGIFLRRTSRSVRSIESSLERKSKEIGDKVEAMTAVLLLIEGRLQRLEGRVSIEGDRLEDLILTPEPGPTRVRLSSTFRDGEGCIDAEETSHG